MSASTAIFDFRENRKEITAEPFPTPEYTTGSRDVSHRVKPGGGLRGNRKPTSNEKKQVRRRVRRIKKVSTEDMMILYDGRTIDMWDHEELARGRPRAADGSFRGKGPAWIDRTLHEDIVRRFETIVREEMNAHTIEALTVLGKVLSDTETDDKGKPIVAAGTKLDAAKFLIEHVVGKPKQRTETDISVKLQGILGHAIVNPNQSGGFQPTAGYIDAGSHDYDDVD